VKHRIAFEIENFHFATVVPSSNAKNPMIPKMINPAKKAVKTLPVAIIKASLYCNRKILQTDLARDIHLNQILPETVVESIVTG